MTAKHTGWLAALLLAVGALTACGSTTSRASDLDQAIDAYESGRYSAAAKHGEAAMRAPSTRPEGAYVAGLSAYRTGDLDKAASYFKTAIDSAHEAPACAGRARASLGLVYLDQGRPQDAIPPLRLAYTELSGVDRAEAARHLSQAFDDLGDGSSAARWRERAGGTALARTGSGRFAIQVGAFRRIEGARTAAVSASGDARRAGYDEPRVVESSDQIGGVRYFVRFGSFASRTDAEAARQRIGRLDYIVTAETLN